MLTKFLPLPDQTIVINGAASALGIEITNAILAMGVRAVLVVPTEEIIPTLNHKIPSNGFAIYVKSQGNNEADFRRIADTAVRTFGGFDSWVNITSASIGGSTLELKADELRQNGDVAFWTVVFGSRIAAMHYLAANRAGTIINVYSNFTSGDINLPIYFALRQAVKAWTNGFRREIENASDKISVTFVEPDHNDQTNWDANDRTPQRIARAVLFCMTHRKPEVHVSPERTLMGSLLGAWAPKPERERSYNPAGEAADVAGRTPSPHVSQDAKKAKHPLVSAIVFAGIGAGLWMFSKKKK